MNYWAIVTPFLNRLGLGAGMIIGAFALFLCGLTLGYTAASGGVSITWDFDKKYINILPIYSNSKENVAGRVSGK